MNSYGMKLSILMLGYKLPLNLDSVIIRRNYLFYSNISFSSMLFFKVFLLLLYSRVEWLGVQGLGRWMGLGQAANFLIIVKTITCIPTNHTKP